MLMTSAKNTANRGGYHVNDVQVKLDQRRQSLAGVRNYT
jgi:hypothetical protein